MRAHIVAVVATAILLVDCGAPIVSTRHNGWHRCPGATKGCTANELCSRYGCRWWGPGAEPQDQGSGDLGGE